MSKGYSITQGDLEPPMVVALRVNDETHALPGGATYKMRWKRPDCTVVEVDLERFEDSAGLVIREWVAGDTDMPGEHEAQIVEIVGGRPRTFPTGTIPLKWTVTRRFGD